MYFTEEDINFSLLKDYKVFEELCFDLLYKLGFHALKWRQGGADNGRDVEAYFTNSNPLVGPYTEKWFVECKYYTKGIPVDEISTKFDWARVENAQHLIIITNSYLSTSARTWMEKRMDKEYFKLHLLEGKKLVNLILGYPDLVTRYFKSDSEKLFIDSLRNWIHHNTIPSKRAIALMLKDNNFDKMSINELAFMMIACTFTPPTIELTSYFEDLNFNFDFLFDKLAKRENDTSKSLNLEEIETVYALGSGEISENKIYNSMIKCYFDIKIEGTITNGYYCFIYSEENQGIEVLLLRNEDLDVRVTLIQNADEYIDIIFNLLDDKR